ncbi:uncharacterized protein C1orf21 homolog isoform X1 [Monodelphis domestica]|uniref:uncharacterized protein C1orf21 homolog isoform X1 n=2 Tax=Monodelphis domestica TaxID=13616 RepID=UPI0024E1E1E1|nr:uncharacterized protein C1orf21 homolog isoform X1 [Monodelphis domestica]XP_056671619.1 uncharacterized protein C1orf21 homolog isoform X1 [Monodelphis domestica]XP_056671620.1 uncharacterized protein C1orf21 homolog isoform X1 [Monodelphis domestica]XP_056671621.1 uncharacterized protein C1orf21 homolog isoform X1 [Monodelphis domestica]XP_056671622.1 uncharacterized protein C1orf21 homolog isoform X1 [Monodelphis domestica]XP_056671623.1 uncharacterized protein C1orf21 homolog isoform X1
MGCASAKHVATVQNEEEAQKGKNYQNGDVFADEYRIKPVEEVKYMKNGGEDEQKIAARNQENLEKSASSNVRLKPTKEVPGLVHQPRANMHISESQQEFFRMLDEKIEKVQLFISTCNGEHIRYSTDTFAGLCHQLTNTLVERKQPLRGIGTLRRAIDKMQRNTNQLTSVHADLCQLCLLAKCFKPALLYLDVDMTDMCKENGASDAKHFLCYYYYGGMIYTGLKNFERALYFYEQALTTPAMALSHIMLESYKKYILVSLILLGRVQQLPKHTSQIVGQFIKPLSNAYHELAQVYSTNNPSELRTLVNKHSKTFTRDNNMGLVKQCFSSIYKKNIQRLTKTCLTLSLQDLASRVQLLGPQEAEKYVLHMIEDGEIFASINQKDGVVHFHDNPEKYNNPAMLHNIDQEVQKCIELDERLKAMDQEITMNPQFVQKSTGSQEDDSESEPSSYS